MEENSNGNAKFTHFDESGRPVMVDVSDKDDSHRVAVARAEVHMLPSTRAQIEAGGFRKGDVLLVAQLAGIMGAKRTPDLIPLCHPIPITKVNVTSSWLPDSDSGLSRLEWTAEVNVIYKTGVEMEALTACTTAALTVYDMCKAVDKGMQITNVRLVYKSGGKSGVFESGESVSK
jgi:cyclic pyranopterin monophosphate synthase